MFPLLASRSHKDNTQSHSGTSNNREAQRREDDRKGMNREGLTDGQAAVDREAGRETMMIVRDDDDEKPMTKYSYLVHAHS